MPNNLLLSIGNCVLKFSEAPHHIIFFYKGCIVSCAQNIRVEAGCQNPVRDWTG